MTDQLKALPDDALVRLKLRVDAEFKLRQRRLFAIGKQAVMFSEKRDRDVRLLITGWGPKNVQAVECDEYGNPLSGGRLRWRCHPSFLMPALPKAKPAPAPTGVGKDAPQSASVAAW